MKDFLEVKLPLIISILLIVSLIGFSIYSHIKELTKPRYNIDYEEKYYDLQSDYDDLEERLNELERSLEEDY